MGVPLPLEVAIAPPPKSALPVGQFAVALIVSPTEPEPLAEIVDDEAETI